MGEGLSEEQMDKLLAEYEAKKKAEEAAQKKAKAAVEKAQRQETDLERGAKEGRGGLGAPTRKLLDQIED